MKYVLVADDENDLRAIVGVMLSNLKCEWQAISSGEQALDAYALARHSDRPFDLLILDLAMPYTNGFEVAERIRSAGDLDTPILFMTAFEKGEELSDRAMTLTAIPICRKPFCATEMMAAIGEALGMPGEVVAVN